MFDYDMNKEQIMEILLTMDKSQLKQYAREAGIKLYTKVETKMRAVMRDVIYTRLHHGDAFRG